jgi:hypothetical protein
MITIPALCNGSVAALLLQAPSHLATNRHFTNSLGARHAMQLLLSQPYFDAGAADMLGPVYVWFAQGAPVPSLIMCSVGYKPM